MNLDPDPAFAPSSTTQSERRRYIERKLLTVPEVMATLALGRSKVYDLIRSGQLESIKIGRGRRVPADALDALVTRLREEAA